MAVNQPFKKSKVNDKTLRRFVDSGHAAFTVFMLAENVCGWEWAALNYISRSAKVPIHKKEIKFFIKDGKAHQDPEDLEASRLAVGTQKLVKKKDTKLLLVPIVMYIGSKTRGLSYDDDDWNTSHRMGLMVNPKTKDFYLFDPCPTMRLFSKHVITALEKRFRLLGYKHEAPCGMRLCLQRDDDEMCVPWSLYFFGMVVANSGASKEAILGAMSYKGLLKFLYYLFRNMRNEGEACNVYALGDEYPEVQVATFETLEDAVYGLAPEEFDAIDVYGVRH
jgi:hypothetical protein